MASICLSPVLWTYAHSPSCNWATSESGWDVILGTSLPVFGQLQKPVCFHRTKPIGCLTWVDFWLCEVDFILRNEMAWTAQSSIIRCRLFLFFTRTFPSTSNFILCAIVVYGWNSPLHREAAQSVRNILKIYIVFKWCISLMLLWTACIVLWGEIMRYTLSSDRMVHLHWFLKSYGSLHQLKTWPVISRVVWEKNKTKINRDIKMLRLAMNCSLISVKQND